MMKTARLLSLSFGSLLAAGSCVMAVAPIELQQRLAEGESLTLMDVRATAFFQRGHIPGAINVPFEIIDQKPLPKIGKVIVYDGGLGEAYATRALKVLQAKPGISAEALEGGLAAWETARGATTADPNMVQSELPRITYDKLKALPVDASTVLVDLRTAGGPVKTAASPRPQLDLAAEFPGAQVTKSPFSVGPQKTASGKPGASPLLVLIDKGDGSADQIGRALKANGNQRFVILVGGEEMIARKGKAGLERSGSVYTTDTPPTTLHNTNR